MLNFKLYLFVWHCSLIADKALRSSVPVSSINQWWSSRSRQPVNLRFKSEGFVCGLFLSLLYLAVAFLGVSQSVFVQVACHSVDYSLFCTCISCLKRLKRWSFLTYMVNFHLSFPVHPGITMPYETIQAAFPNSVSKVHWKAHHRYIHSIDVNTPAAGSSNSLEKELQEYVKVLEQHIAELEGVQSSVHAWSSR